MAHEWRRGRLAPRVANRLRQGDSLGLRLRVEELLQRAPAGLELPEGRCALTQRGANRHEGAPARLMRRIDRDEALGVSRRRLKPPRSSKTVDEAHEHVGGLAPPSLPLVRGPGVEIIADAAELIEEVAAIERRRGFERGKIVAAAQPLEVGRVGSYRRIERDAAIGRRADRLLAQELAKAGERLTQAAARLILEPVRPQKRGEGFARHFLAGSPREAGEKRERLPARAQWLAPAVALDPGLAKEQEARRGAACGFSPVVHVRARFDAEFTLISRPRAPAPWCAERLAHGLRSASVGSPDRPAQRRLEGDSSCAQFARPS
jgi:hypothetical protein